MRTALPAWGDPELQGLSPNGAGGGTVRGAAGPAAPGDKTGLPGRGKTVWDKLGGGGAEYPHGERRHLALKPAAAQ